MSNTNRKLQKKKDRERKVREKLSQEREKLRAPVMEANKQKRKDVVKKEEDKQFHRRLERAASVYSNLSPATIEQINRNIEILRALESEYVEEMASKMQLNASLESEGHVTLSDKLAVLQQDTAATQKVKFGGSAECAMTPNENS